MESGEANGKTKPSRGREDGHSLARHDLDSVVTNCGTTCFAIHSCFSCKTQFAPLSRQSGLEQGATIFPLFRILVSAHAACWYRPVSGAVVPTTQSMPRCAIKVPRPPVTVLLFHGGPLANHALTLSCPSATNQKMQDQGDHCEDEQ